MVHHTMTRIFTTMTLVLGEDLCKDAGALLDTLIRMTKGYQLCALMTQSTHSSVNSLCIIYQAYLGVVHGNRLSFTVYFRQS